MKKHSLTASLITNHTPQSSGATEVKVLKSRLPSPGSLKLSLFGLNQALAEPVVESAYNYKEPARSGALWEEGEEEFLLASYEAGDDVMTLCRKHQRPLGGVLARLCKLKMITREGGDSKYWSKLPKWNQRFFRVGTKELYADYSDLKKQYQF